MLFIGDARFIPGTDYAPFYDDEVKAVAELQERGIIRDLFRYVNGGGALLVLQGKSREEIETELNQLPFVKNRVMTIPIEEVEE